MAPVYVDGEKTVTLKGERIAEEFQELVEKYVARRFARKDVATRHRRLTHDRQQRRHPGQQEMRALPRRVSALDRRTGAGRC